MTNDSAIERINHFKRWYTQKQNTYDQLAKYILARIESYLKQQQFYNIAYSSSRAKSIESAVNKAQKKVKKDNKYVYKYSNPKSDIMDFAGVRIVVYLPLELEVVCNAIEVLFQGEVRQLDSENKAKLLGNNKVGYLSIHYVVELMNPEMGYDSFRNLKCEIQIRTILQDAWAQIFHDRIYKGALHDETNSEIDRKVNLLAGSLELIDNQINDVVCILDSRPENIGRKTYLHLTNLPITRDSLIRYINILTKGKCEKSYNIKNVLHILNKLGYRYIKDLQNVVDSEFINDLLLSNISLTVDKVVRYILVVSGSEKFSECLEGCSYLIDSDTYTLLNKYIDISHFCSTHSIEVLCEEEHKYDK